MPRRSLRPHLNQIRTWVRQGRTDAWVAHQLEVSARDIDQFKRQNELVSDEEPSESASEPATPTRSIYAQRAIGGLLARPRIDVANERHCWALVVIKPEIQRGLKQAIPEIRAVTPQHDSVPAGEVLYLHGLGRANHDFVPMVGIKTEQTLHQTGIREVGELPIRDSCNACWNLRSDPCWFQIVCDRYSSRVTDRFSRPSATTSEESAQTMVVPLCSLNRYGHSALRSIESWLRSSPESLIRRP